MGGAETTRGQRLVLNIQGCPGNASPKPKSGPRNTACEQDTGRSCTGGSTYLGAGGIAHLAETPFGFSTSTLLPITPQTPKHLGFGVIMPFRVRRYTPFGLKTPASWRNGFFDSELFDLRYPANGFFNFQWSYFSAVQVKTNAP